MVNSDGDNSRLLLKSVSAGIPKMDEPEKSGIEKDGKENAGVDNESKILVEDDAQDDESQDDELLPNDGSDQLERALETLELKLSAEELWNEYDP